MNKLRIALLVYCLLALALLGWLIVTNITGSARLSRDLRTQRTQLAEADEANKLAQRELADLEIEQRSARPDYTAQEAVEMSYQVQLAIEKHQATNAKYEQLGVAEQQSAETLSARQIRLVPMIALLLLHAFGLVYFMRPPRQSIMPR